MDTQIKASEVLQKNVQRDAAPQEERPDTVYLAVLGAGKDAYCATVFYSRRRAIAWRDERRQNPSIVANLDAVSCADGDAKRVP